MWADCKEFSHIILMGWFGAILAGFTPIAFGGVIM